MKYTIFQFNQKKAVEYGLNLKDLAILHWFTDFNNTDRMMPQIVDGKTFYWVKYQAIINDLPVLEVKTKDGIYRILKKLSRIGILDHTTIKRDGTYSYYKKGAKFIDLLWVSDEKSEGYGQKTVGGTDEKSEQIDSSITDNSSIKNPPKIDIPDYINKESFDEWIDYRKKDLKKPLTQRSANIMFKTLKYYTKQQQSAYIDKAIESKWASVYPPHTGNTPQKPLYEGDERIMLFDAHREYLKQTYSQELLLMASDNIIAKLDKQQIKPLSGVEAVEAIIGEINDDTTSY